MSLITEELCYPVPPTRPDATQFIEALHHRSPTLADVQRLQQLYREHAVPYPAAYYLPADRVEQLLTDYSAFADVAQLEEAPDSNPGQ